MVRSFVCLFVILYFFFVRNGEFICFVVCDFGFVCFVFAIFVVGG